MTHIKTTKVFLVNSFFFAAPPGQTAEENKNVKKSLVMYNIYTTEHSDNVLSFDIVKLTEIKTETKKMEKCLPTLAQSSRFSIRQVSGWWIGWFNDWQAEPTRRWCRRGWVSSEKKIYKMLLLWGWMQSSRKFIMLNFLFCSRVMVPRVFICSQQQCCTTTGSLCVINLFPSMELFKLQEIN